MTEQILTALGAVAGPTAAGIKAFFSLRDRMTKTEAKQSSNHEIILVKLDSIALLIEQRCDFLEQRINRIEKKVLNGEYHQ